MCVLTRVPSYRRTLLADRGLFFACHRHDRARRCGGNDDARDHRLGGDSQTHRGGSCARGRSGTRTCGSTRAGTGGDGSGFA